MVQYTHTISTFLSTPQAIWFYFQLQSQNGSPEYGNGVQNFLDWTDQIDLNLAGQKMQPGHELAFQKTNWVCHEPAEAWWLLNFCRI